MQIQATLINFEKIMKSINGLSDIDKNKVIKQGLRKAGNVFIRIGKNELKSKLKGTGKGNLLKSFRNKVKKNKLGVITGFSNTGHHAHLIDRGTTERYTKSGYYKGRVRGNLFWSNAINTGKSEAINNVLNGIEEGIQKIMIRRFT